jgi:hypothetical protein
MNRRVAVSHNVLADLDPSVSVPCRIMSAPIENLYTIAASRSGPRFEHSSKRHLRPSLSVVYPGGPGGEDFGWRRRIA